MTRSQAIDELKKLQSKTDWEMAHYQADDILCQLLRELGCDDVVAEYQKIEKWFA